jgi:ribosome-associated translation inhibitor RaiA
MQPLTHQVWEQHFVQLREPVLTRFPQVEEWELARVNDDYDALVELVQRSTGMDADRVLEQLRALDVEELGIGTGTPEEAEEDNGNGGHGSLAKLALGKGFAESERARITERLSKLNKHLKRFPADDTWLEISVKDRDTTSQALTLSAELPGLGKVVVGSREGDLRDALADVREDMITQITRELDKRSRGAR